MADNEENNLDSIRATEQFLKLFMENQKRIYLHILMQTLNNADADDLMQETVTVLWRKYSQFQPGSNFRAWACRIADNLVKNFRKKQAQSKLQFSDAILEGVASRCAGGFDDIDQRVEKLKGCLARMSKRDQQLIQLRYEQDLRVGEISRRVDRPVQGLYQAFSRIHNTLLQCVRRALASQERI